jgi:hypothetical protein
MLGAWAAVCKKFVGTTTKGELLFTTDYFSSREEPPDNMVGRREKDSSSDLVKDPGQPAVKAKKEEEKMGLLPANLTMCVVTAPASLPTLAA